ncbi:uncharacterized protein LOC143517773 isoform X2 [Brachyhypopomus gauderio]|uniref:uncharacterized protein LOC143517773 isoform X2 n=1 Tax=Brachyhypopomus gauderio TaxID=698409 RepID=UPI0040411994
MEYTRQALGSTKKHSQDAATVGKHNLTKTGINTSPSRDTRNDWILYTVPSFAFVIGLVLFTLVCKTQNHRKTRRISAVRRHTNGTAAKHSDKGHSLPPSEGNNTTTTCVCPSTEDGQSYENVAAAIYNNQDKVTYYVTQDEDYITPDAGGDAGAVQNHNDHLQTPHTLTDTDGESYENMEGCVYAQPRRNAHTHTADNDDYIDPDEEQKIHLDQPTSESYENLSGSVCPHGGNPTAYSSTHTIDNELYVHMDSIQHSYGAQVEKRWRGESERESGAQVEKRWRGESERESGAQVEKRWRGESENSREGRQWVHRQTTI